MSSDCLFCKIIRGEIPSKKVAETEHAFAFEDINPQAPKHILVIHKTHTESLATTSDNNLLAEVFGAARDIAAQAGLSNYRLVVNNGPEAGQTVFHLHVHLLAGRPFTWPPG
ncbi:MAG TPA: histidine triad nucleotide-binding protein [Oculatellaceae cyanobacterium]|jgi:histidine triad (HIT) family protein